MKRNGSATAVLPSSSFSSSTVTLTRSSLPLFLIIVALLANTHNVSAAMVSSDSEEKVETFKSEEGPQNGTFATPKYPEEYPKNVRRRFQFRAKLTEVVWIIWHDFDLEKPVASNQQCRNDYVEVIVIDYYNVQHVHGRYCGNTPPPNFTTMQYSLDIIFQSSVTKHHQGFRGTYQFIPEQAVPPPPSIYPGKANPQQFGCGGMVQGLYGGTIKSPGYPEDYPANVDCNWVIRVRPDRKIFIKVVEIELSPGLFTQCDDAQLVVLDGYALLLNESQTIISTLPIDNQYQRIVLCGDPKYHNEEGLKSVMSDRNRMIIRFRTNRSAPEAIKAKRRQVGSPVGFQLVWTEVSLQEKCDKFYCRGGDYCIDEGKKVCAERKRYCIDTSLVCDGVPNCAEFDDSDEENCYSQEIILAGASLFVLLVLVIFVVVCCQRRHGRKLMRRAINQTTTQETITGNDSNFNCSPTGKESTSNAKGPLRVALMNKMDKSPLPRNRGGEISVLPQNCYPSTALPVDEREDVAVRQPFLAVPNNVPPTKQAQPANSQFRYPDVVGQGFISGPPESSKKSSKDKGRPSITVMLPKVPEINVVKAGNDIWEQRGGDLLGVSPREVTPESMSDQESPLWKEFEPDRKGTAEVNVIRRRKSMDFPMEPDLPPPIFPQPVPEESDEQSDSIEMVTFNPRPPPPPLQAAPPLYPVRVAAPPSRHRQGILKSSSSLPPSANPPSYRAVVSVDIPASSSYSMPRRTAYPPPMVGPTTTTVAVHRVPAVSHRRHPVSPAINAPPSHSFSQPSQSFPQPKMVRQKAVEFQEPSGHPMRRANPPPPLNMARQEGGAESNGNSDRSPSPWHQRVKPTAV